MASAPDVVVTADELLQQSEAVPDHERRARRIKDAFELLNAYLKEHPTSEHREYIENRKLAYLRSHLTRLSVLTEPDPETWLFNFILFATSEHEVAKVLEQHPELRSWYDSFAHSQSEWATKELVPLLERAGNNR